MSDGAQKDVTATVAWRSTPSSVATVSQTGLVTAVDFGAASIDFVNTPGNPPRDFTILVLPDGTYILQGQCVQDPNHQCLADARIEIIGGPMSGRATTTDQGGNWTFIGVRGVVQVRVRKEGYITAVQDVPQGAGRDVVAICGPVLAPNGSTTAISDPVCI
jgi:hypothetical protein